MVILATKFAKKDGHKGRLLNLVSRPAYRRPANRELTVSDVHRDFEAETQVSRCRGGPCHVDLLELA